MIYVFETTKYGRLGLIAALDIWKDVHVEQRDQLVADMQAEMGKSEPDLKKISKCAQDANEWNECFAEIDSYMKLWKDEANKLWKEEPTQYDVKVRMSGNMLAYVEHALVVHTDVLHDQAFEAIPVVQNDEEAVTISRDAVKSLRDQLEETLLRLGACERLLGEVKGRARST